MRKIIAIALIFISVTASSCSAKNVIGADNVPATPKPAQTEEQNKPDEKVIVGAMKSAYEGRLDNLQTGVGDELKMAISELGEPAELAHFEGSSYIIYENISFILDKVINKTSDEADILGIVASEGYEIFGVKVGMTPDEIKSILGAAAHEYKDGKGDEEMWKLEYIYGDYSLVFFFNDNSSPGTSAYLSKLEL